jgi:hypothetical protein
MGAYVVLVGKPDVTSTLRRPRCSWGVGNMDLKELRWEGMEWIILTWDRYKWGALVSTVMDLRFHKIQGISGQAELLFASQEEHATWY